MTIPILFQDLDNAIYLEKPIMKYFDKIINHRLIPGYSSGHLIGKNYQLHNQLAAATAKLKPAQPPVKEAPLELPQRLNLEVTLIPIRDLQATTVTIMGADSEASWDLYDDDYCEPLELAENSGFSAVQVIYTGNAKLKNIVFQGSHDASGKFRLSCLTDQAIYYHRFEVWNQPINISQYLGDDGRYVDSDTDSVNYYPRGGQFSPELDLEEVAPVYCYFSKATSIQTNLIDYPNALADHQHNHAQLQDDPANRTTLAASLRQLIIQISVNNQETYNYQFDGYDFSYDQKYIFYFNRI